MNIKDFKPVRLDGLVTFILFGCLLVLCAILNIFSSVQDWERGKSSNLPMDAFFLALEVFGVVICFLCARLVIRQRKRDWQEQEKLIAARKQ